MHDITPASLKQQGSDFDLSMDLLGGGNATSFTDLQAFVDLTSVCTSSMDPVSTGVARLMMRVSVGENSQLAGKVDSVPANNEWVGNVNVDCGSGKLNYESLRSGKVIIGLIKSWI